MTNPWNPDLASAMGAYYVTAWAEQGLSGAYNDDMLKLIGPEQFKVVSGGSLAEQPAMTVHSDEAGLAYRLAFAELLAAIGVHTGSDWMSGNISGENLFMSVSSRPFVDALSAFLREDYLQSGLGITGYFGIAKAWGACTRGRARVSRRRRRVHLTPCARFAPGRVRHQTRPCWLRLASTRLFKASCGAAVSPTETRPTLSAGRWTSSP